jgi:hypothetical protein
MTTIAVAAFFSASFAIPWTAGEKVATLANVQQRRSDLLPRLRADADRAQARLNESQERLKQYEAYLSEGYNRLTRPSQEERQSGERQIRIYQNAVETLRPELETRQRAVTEANASIAAAQGETEALERRANLYASVSEALTRAAMPICFFLLSVCSGSLTAWARAKHIREDADALTIIGGAVALPFAIFAEKLLPALAISWDGTDVFKLVGASAFAGLIVVEVFSAWRLRAQVGDKQN